MTTGGSVSKSPENETQPTLFRTGETQNITRADRLRCATMHAHADMTVGIRLLRRGRLIMAWRKLRQGYKRLGKALDTGKKDA